MNYEEIKQKVIDILDTFGMSGKKAAEAMGVTHATFRKKKLESDPTHNFNQKNLDDLVGFIKQKTEGLNGDYYTEILSSFIFPPYIDDELLMVENFVRIAEKRFKNFRLDSYNKTKNSIIISFTHDVRIFSYTNKKSKD